MPIKFIYSERALKFCALVSTFFQMFTVQTCQEITNRSITSVHLCIHILEMTENRLKESENDASKYKLHTKTFILGWVEFSPSEIWGFS
jgi:hypothetical protein